MCFLLNAIHSSVPSTSIDVNAPPLRKIATVIKLKTPGFFFIYLKWKFLLAKQFDNTQSPKGWTETGRRTFLFVFLRFDTQVQYLEQQTFYPMVAVTTESAFKLHLELS